LVNGRDWGREDLTQKRKGREGRKGKKNIYHVEEEVHGGHGGIQKKREF